MSGMTILPGCESDDEDCGRCVDMRCSIRCNIYSAWSYSLQFKQACIAQLYSITSGLQLVSPPVKYRVSISFNTVSTLDAIPLVIALFRGLLIALSLDERIDPALAIHLNK